MNLVGEVGEPRDVLAESLGFKPRLEKGLALLLGEDRRDLLDLLEHVVRGPVQDLATLVRGELRPRSKRFGRRLRGLVDVRRPALRYLVDDLAGGRVADFICLAGRG